MLATFDLAGTAPAPSLVCSFASHLDAFGRVLRLSDGLTIGRADQADLPVDDRGASRLHARIARRQDGAWTITDLGSTNGTFVNGVRVRSAVLRDGDEIRVGAVTAFRFSARGDLRRTALAA
ncbi:FHA domain-containing protein [Anaeromyxobacter dehalogenans]|uniref:FHA domain containing protein n=1 Tax=Anaeromyxobacter dehalogenans (strain 2CP-C) TaxID=290397 RepID=Q2IIW1_ANADE|nr:FHA domain-containing protein [Anaeromyxobacter dehalogenans]ABC81588.1 FHA domain containing protein [Anaeromyxobacter dehalogenans 2CP-C]